MSRELANVEELLRVLAQEDVRLRPAFRVQLTERLIAAMARRPPVLLWRPVLVGATLILLLALAGWLLTPRVTSWATLAVEDGEALVTWQRPLYFRWSRSGTVLVSQGQPFLLTEGDRVAFSEGGGGSILFPDGGRLRLAGATVLVLAEMNPAQMTTRANVEAGEVWAEVTPLPDLFFEIQTPAATVRVRGTVFRTRVLAADHTYSATDNGTTQVTLLDPAQGYPSVEVPAGYEVDAIIGQPLMVRPQAPLIDRLTLDGTTVEAGDTLASNRPGLTIFGKANAGAGYAVLLCEGALLDRSPVAPEGEFCLRFHAPTEGEYPLCIAIEAADGARSPCASFLYRYDTTPPSVIRLLEPTTPEVSGETVTIRGETEPGATVRLNGEAVPVGPTGAFATRRALQPGENPMTLEACDEAGNCTRLEFVLSRR